MEKAKEHRYHPVLFQGPLLAFDLAEVTMKVCCCIGLLGTFRRIVDVHDIPQMFLFLPTLLVILLIIQKFTHLKEDAITLGMVSGALIGVVTGFLSGIERLVQSDFPDEFTTVAKKSPAVYNLELLHIPVVIGSVMYSFCLVFDRLPKGNQLKWASMVGMCGSVLATMMRSSMAVPQKYETNSTNSYFFFFVALLSFFLIGLFPEAKPAQKAWIVCIIVWMVQVMWQMVFFDNLIWNWEENFFPIPGCLTGIIIVFFADVLISSRALPAMKVYNRRKSSGSLAKQPMEPILNAFLWHSVTFIVQKISLYMIQQKNKSGPFIPSYTFEATITCVLSLFFLYIISAHLKARPLTRTVLVIITLTYYAVQGLCNLGLPNGLFIDIMLGQTIVYTIQAHHIEQTSGE